MVDLTGIDLTAFVHRWEESSATSYGAEWVCIDCEIDCQGMPPDRTAICKARLLAEVVALRAQVEVLKEGAGSLHKAYARGRDEERMAVVAFLRGWRDDPIGEFTRRQVSLVAMDIENGAHHRV